MTNIIALQNKAPQKVSYAIVSRNAPILYDQLAEGTKYNKHY